MKTFEPQRALHAAVLLCLILSFAAGCGAKKPVQSGTPGAPAVPDTPLHKLTSAVYDIAAYLNGGERELEIVTDAGLIDLQEATVAAQGINAANDCNRTFNTRLKAETSVNSTNKQRVLAWSQDLSTCLNGALNDNVLGFKNATAKQRVQAALGFVNIALSQIVGTLSQVPDVASERKTLTLPTPQTKTLQPQSTQRSTEGKLYGKYATGDWIHRAGFANYRTTGNGAADAERSQGSDTARREDSAGREPTTGRATCGDCAGGRSIDRTGRADERGYRAAAGRVLEAAPGEEKQQLAISTQPSAKNAQRGEENLGTSRANFAVVQGEKKSGRELPGATALLGLGLST